MIKEIAQSFELLEDELSKRIFESKTKWYFQGGEDETVNLLYDEYKESRIFDLERYPKHFEYAICGCGNYGRKTLKALKHAGYRVRCFLDNDIQKQGTQFEGIEIVSFSQFINNGRLNRDVIVIIDNTRLKSVFFNELFELGFPQDRIYMTKEDIVRSAFGNIYFDLEELRFTDEEIFIDAGSFNGETSLSFIETVNGKYKKIYACEPMTDGYEMSHVSLAQKDNVEICKVALSNSVGEATFAQSFQGLMGSRLGDSGDYIEKVRLETIDHMLEERGCSFIKMDIEGAELDALKGAEFTLKTYKPKLAISLYHKNEDLYEIPLWLKNIVPEYKFYLRHYSNKRWDLVLYCIAE